VALVKRNDILTRTSQPHKLLNQLRLRLLLVLLCFGFITANCQRAQPLTEFSLPIEIVDNRPFVAITISGKTFHFIVDSGGFNSIDVDAANELNLDLRGKFQMPGAGEKTVDAWSTVIGSFSLGDRSFKDRKFYVLPLNEIKENLKLPYLDGIIGYDFFRDSVVRIDYPNKKIIFSSEFKGNDGIPFTIHGSHLPEFEVEIDGSKSRFVIDTGDRSKLTLGRVFSDQLLKRSEYVLSEEKITGYGLGGAIFAQTFSLRSLRIGRIEAKNVETRIPNLNGGAFSRPDFTGSIGSGLLKDYKITIDYPNRLLYLE
jgi:predicted aspartyl protease